MTTHERVSSAADGLGVGIAVAPRDGARILTHWTVDRWDADQTAWAQRRSGLAEPSAADFARLGTRPYDTSEVIGNVVTTAGWTRVLNLAIAAGSLQAYDATHCRIGVGTGTTPSEAAADTDLIGVVTTNRYWKLVDSRSVTTNVLTIVATFGTAVANFAWNEFGIDAGTADGTGAVTAPLLNHKVGIAQGTKASGQIWTATATLTCT